MIEQGFTHQEWNQLLQLNEEDPQEAVRRFLSGISRPIERKSMFPKVTPDRREYNLVVSIMEAGDRASAINLLESLLTSAPQQENGLIRFRMAGKKTRGLPRTKANVYAKIFNAGRNRLNPMAAEDRVTGEYPYINPGETYEGFIYFPYLASWLRGGRKAQLLGV